MISRKIENKVKLMKVYSSKEFLSPAGDEGYATLEKTRAEIERLILLEAEEKYGVKFTKSNKVST